MIELIILDVESPGIYQIRNTINGARYIGSSVNIARRWRAHKKQLLNGDHHSQHLQRAWNKYGDRGFVFEVLENCPKKKLIEVEQRWIDSKRPEYNMAPRAGSSLGVKHSAETKRKRSELNKGNKFSLGRFVPESTRQAVAEANRKRKGFVRSREAVEATAAAHRGMKRSAETRKKISESLTGVKRSPRTLAHREALSQALKGKMPSQKVIDALQKGRKAYVTTDEHKKQISESLRQAYATGKRQREKTEEHKNKIGKHYAKLTDDQVREIRRLRNIGVTGVRIAEMFNTTTSTVSQIWHKQRYRWVSD